MNDRQRECVVDNLKNLGLAAVIGGVGDVVLVGSRLSIDMFGVAIGGAALVYCVRLTGRIRGGSL